jgi:hypothetical protein
MLTDRRYPKIIIKATKAQKHKEKAGLGCVFWIDVNRYPVLCSY